MISWFYDLLAVSLGVTPIIILLLWLGPMLNKRYSARWRYIMWLVVSLRLMIPASLASILPLALQLPARATDGFIPTHVLPKPLSNTTDLAAADISLVQVLLAVYLMGVTVCLFHELSVYISFRRNILRWSRKPSDDRIEDLLTELKTERNIQREILVRINKKVSSPMMVGFVSPTLLLPAESFTAAELRMILAHELLHLQRHDIWYKLALMITAAVHWFNPLVHLMVRAAKQDMELSCDDYILRCLDIDAKKSYCNLLLSLALQNNQAAGPMFSTSIGTGKDTLEARIKSIFDTSRKRPGIAALAMMALVVAVSGASVEISGAESWTSPATQHESLESPMDTPTANEEYISADRLSQGNRGAEPHSPGEDEPRVNSGESSPKKDADQKAQSLTGNANGAEVVMVDLHTLEQNMQVNHNIQESLP